MPSDPRRIIILGSTGSIGTQTLDVIRHLNAAADRGEHDHRFTVVGLAAGSNADQLFEQARDLGVRNLALRNASNDSPAPPGNTSLLTGPDAAEQLVRDTDADIVMCAIVGAAGLPATLAAVELGRDAALANKEALVAAGSLITAACKSSGAKLLPVDSEHAALWACLAAGPDGFRLPPHDEPRALSRVTLTASGGALRDWPREKLESATPEDALNHPNWDMGAKVTIDTATLLNKAYELVEAHWFFGVPADKLHAVVHPQSIVHAIADFDDGSSVAHLATPDMRLPILNALTAPDRPRGLTTHVSLADCQRLTFETPDLDRFPAIALGREIIERGGVAGATVSAGAEEAVNAFLKRQVPFTAIEPLARHALDAVGDAPLNTLEDALNAEREARDAVRSALASYPLRTPTA